MRRLAHGLIVGMLAAVVLTAGAGVASAHALLSSSDPADGASLPKAPSEIRLTFTESPDPALSTILVLDSGGTKLPVGPPTLQPPRTLTASLPAHLPNGVYTVSWQTVSTQDGHETAGVFAFGVGPVEGTIAPGVAPTFSTSGPTPFSVAAKTALYAGLMLLVGAAVVGLGLFGGAPRSLRIVGLAAALLAFGGAIGLLGAEQQHGRRPAERLRADRHGPALPVAGGRDARRRDLRRARRRARAVARRPLGVGRGGGRRDGDPRLQRSRGRRTGPAPAAGVSMAPLLGGRSVDRRARPALVAASGAPRHPPTTDAGSPAVLEPRRLVGRRRRPHRGSARRQRARRVVEPPRRPTGELWADGAREGRGRSGADRVSAPRTVSGTWRSWRKTNDPFDDSSGPRPSSRSASWS